MHGSSDDERSERTRSVPSVASRRVAAPYGVDDLAILPHGWSGPYTLMILKGQGPDSPDWTVKTSVTT